MLTFGGRRIYLAAGATDMRKSFNGRYRHRAAVPQHRSWSPGLRWPLRSQGPPTAPK
jgi:hypothetical protein